MKMKIVWILLFCLIISNFKLHKCESDKRMLINEEEPMTGEKLETEDSGVGDSGVGDSGLPAEEGDVPCVDKEEKNDNVEASDISSDVERVMNHEDDVEKQQMIDRDGENDGFEKYEGVFGGYGDDTRSKRVKRVEE